MHNELPRKTPEATSDDAPPSSLGKFTTLRNARTSLPAHHLYIFFSPFIIESATGKHTHGTETTQLRPEKKKKDSTASKTWYTGQRPPPQHVRAGTSFNRRPSMHVAPSPRILTRHNARAHAPQIGEKRVPEGTRSLKRNVCSYETNHHAQTWKRWQTRNNVTPTQPNSADTDEKTTFCCNSPVYRLMSCHES